MSYDGTPCNLWRRAELHCFFSPARRVASNSSLCSNASREMRYSLGADRRGRIFHHRGPDSLSKKPPLLTRRLPAAVQPPRQYILLQVSCCAPLQPYCPREPDDIPRLRLQQLMRWDTGLRSSSPPAAHRYSPSLDQTPYSRRRQHVKPGCQLRNHCRVRRQWERLLKAIVPRAPWTQDAALFMPG